MAGMKAPGLLDAARLTRRGFQIQMLTLLQPHCRACSMQHAALALCLIAGFAFPALVLDEGAAEHCTQGCKPTIATRDNAVCREIAVIITPLSGFPGVCECDGAFCVKPLDCNIELQFDFQVAGTLPGCVFDRKVGGTWGQTGYTTEILGCGSFGRSRVVGYSATCDPNVINCSVIMDVYCTKCAGVCP